MSVEALEALAPRLACAYGGKARGSRRVRVLSRDFALPGWGEPTEQLQRGPTRLLLYEAERVAWLPSDDVCAAVGGGGGDG